MDRRGFLGFLAAAPVLHAARMFSPVDRGILDLPGFVPVAEYWRQRPRVPYEFGTVLNVRYIKKCHIDREVNLNEEWLDG